MSSSPVLPSDFPIGNFSSTMTKKQNQSLNNLLNSITSASNTDPSLFPIKFYRARHIDSFYNISSSHRGGGKVRVSRDREGNVVRDGVIRKKRIADLNVTSPRSAFDWRVSINTEEPSESFCFYFYFYFFSPGFPVYNAVPRFRHKGSHVYCLR